MITVLHNHPQYRMHLASSHKCMIMYYSIRACFRWHEQRIQWTRQIDQAIHNINRCIVQLPLNPATKPWMRQHINTWLVRNGDLNNFQTRTIQQLVFCMYNLLCTQNNFPELARESIQRSSSPLSRLNANSFGCMCSLRMALKKAAASWRGVAQSHIRLLSSDKPSVEDGQVIRLVCS